MDLLVLRMGVTVVDWSAPNCDKPGVLHRLGATRLPRTNFEVGGTGHTCDAESRRWRRTRRMARAGTVQQLFVFDLDHPSRWKTCGERPTSVKVQSALYIPGGQRRL